MVTYDYQGMSHCLEEVNKCIQQVNHAMSDVNHVIMSLESVFKTKDVADAQTAAYKLLLSQMNDNVLEPLTQQHDYVQNCMDEAAHGDRSLASGWT